MKLYKKIIKALFVGVTLSVFFYFLYEALLKDAIRGYPIDWSFGLLLLLVFLFVAFYHVKFFKVYETTDTWESTSVFDIFLIVINFCFSGFIILSMLFFVFEFQNVRTIGAMIYGLYGLIEGLKVNQYLKRDLKYEIESSIDELGKE